MIASRFCFCTALLLALVGMGWGIAMAVSHDHATAPGHAHLSLLGWVSLFLMGLFCRDLPALDLSPVALVQAAVWALGSAGLAAGVALIYLGRPQAEPLAAISALIVFADMLLFAWLVLRSNRHRWAAAAPADRSAPGFGPKPELRR